MIVFGGTLMFTAVDFTGKGTSATSKLEGQMSVGEKEKEVKASEVAKLPKGTK